MGQSAPASLEDILSARHDYFESGNEDHRAIDPAVYRSWHRCVSTAKRTHESVEFEPIRRDRLSELVLRNTRLLDAARGPLSELEKAVAGAGYAILLTDPEGHAVTVRGDVEGQQPLIRQAFRQGVNLSEEAVGTTAMSCAVYERRPVRVFGPEHFYNANGLFHCAAAPIFDPEGGVLGAIDITRGASRPDFGALTLVARCASVIEFDLMMRTPAAAIITLAWQAHSMAPHADLMFALDEAGSIIAVNEATRRFTGIDPVRASFRFEDIFDAGYAQTLSTLRRAAHPVSVRLRSGICMLASLVGNVASPARQTAPRRSAGTGLRAPQAALDEVSFGDPAIDKNLDVGLKVLENGLPLLLLGETGTGKDVLASHLHRRSARASAPFVAINCAAIPETLIESELFGYEDGAFTGARRGGAAGKLEQANGGTLFLDEIGDMPVSLQARLLRVLETREVCRLGGTAMKAVDFQLICATHQNIEEATRSGRFRLDLYYRINGFTISLLPLRSRRNLRALAESMLKQLSDGARGLSDAAADALARHDWPGNARELRHALTYANAIAAPGIDITPAHLPQEIGAHMTRPAVAETDTPCGVLKTLEREAIGQALDQSNGDVRQAARMLGISRATLYRRLKPSR
ncbi:sigma-54-dependent Fis family transcriptional regulator [Denitromonas iodatirespirans]|uniref:Sigma-54-dependent Fis family transcriptional regulator n=1 Tax=Denitromonas iodatirespirans TaxID=2795389 RepID=A0A944DGD5_DENI1|nr:sigma-54-dependent Fis family transcriptional regulator [Denitromonas iodatirespirans]MBT0963838.1 sigma-54-dependent Fis family transcriptional regulator [Denitromonas iodatirespirans]